MSQIDAADRTEFMPTTLPPRGNRVSVPVRCYRAVRNLFIDFNTRHPERASELGEVLAYCLVQEHLGAAQVASKMFSKTAANMPVRGLDGMHAVFENAR